MSIKTQSKIPKETEKDKKFWEELDADMKKDGLPLIPPPTAPITQDEWSGKLDGVIK